MMRFLSSIGLILGVMALSSAQDTDPALKLRWYGQSMFQLETSNGKKIVFDPHGIRDIGVTPVEADIVLCSQLNIEHAYLRAITNLKAARVFFGLEQRKKGQPAEWKTIDEKVGQARIRTVASYHDYEDGRKLGKNAIFVVEVDDLVICHLGNLGHELSDAQRKAIGPVDVLLIPVGGVTTINGEAAKRVVNQIKPKRFVVPMHYGFTGYDEYLPVDEFLAGQTDVRKLASSELVIPLEAEEAPAKVVVLQLKKPE